MIRSSTGTPPTAVGAAELRHLALLRDRLAGEAGRARRQDLLQILDDLPSVEATEPIRACVVGETKRGKSSLLNALIGRPLLSPVGVDVTTSCWLEVGHGDVEEAEVILANPDSPNRPVRRRCTLGELARYVALDQVQEPVIGVQVRLPADVLRGLVLVDTPGVGGLLGGHTTTTLAALRKADALLFVCESGQPILAPELGFLVEAARRVPTVLVAVTKRDINPDFELVVEETRQRIEDTPGLGDVPVLAVAAPLADRAAQLGDAERARRLRDLSGIEPLLAGLRGYTADNAELLRFENAARVLGEVCRALITRSEEIVTVLAGNRRREEQLRREMAELQTVLDDNPRLTGLVRDRLDRLRQDRLASFDTVVDSLRARYRASAERGSAGDLATLAPRMVGELSGAAVDALESTARSCTTVVADLLRELGGADRWPVTPETARTRFEIGLEPPDMATQRVSVDLAASADMFARLVEILAGSAVVMAALTGPGVVAAGLALVAGAGFLQATGGNEQEQRAALATWVDDSAEQARVTFRRELDHRITHGEQHVERALPPLLAARRQALARLTGEMDEIKSSSSDLQAVLAERRASAAALEGIERELDELVSWASATRGRRGRS
jgi:Dynamin family